MNLLTEHLNNSVNWVLASGQLWLVHGTRNGTSRQLGEKKQNRNVPEQIKTFDINFITVLKLDKCHHCEISANSGFILLAAICIK